MSLGYHGVLPRLWKRFLATGNVSHGLARGRELSTTQAQDRLIVLLDRCQQFCNATTLLNDFKNVTDGRISTQTVRNRLYDAGLKSLRPAIRIPMTTHYIQERLQWAQAHVTLNINDWIPVLFTDKSRLCVDFTDRRITVWRRPNDS